LFQDFRANGRLKRFVEDGPSKTNLFSLANQTEKIKLNLTNQTFYRKIHLTLAR
jgi:hypothetical protein